MPAQLFAITKLRDLDNAIAKLLATQETGVIYLHGNLGTGKTTFVAHWLHALGYKGVVTSPTYGLINEYTVADKTIYHADLYRLASPDELLYLGSDDWDGKTQLIFIEWPEKGAGYLPPADVNASFSLSATSRKLVWETLTK